MATRPDAIFARERVRHYANPQDRVPILASLTDAEWVNGGELYSFGGQDGHGFFYDGISMVALCMSAGGGAPSTVNHPGELSSRTNVQLWATRGAPEGMPW